MFSTKYRRLRTHKVTVFFRSLLASLMVATCSLFILVDTAPPVQATTTCKTITITHHKTHMVFLWRRVRIDKHGKYISKKEHVWRKKIVEIRGRKVIKRIPVKVRRRYSIKTHTEDCTTASTIAQAASVTTTQPTTAITTPPTTTTTPQATSAPSPEAVADLAISTNSIAYTGGSVNLTYTSKNATSCTLSATPSLWSGSNPMQVNCNGSYSLTFGKSTSQQQWIVTFTASGSSGPTAVSSEELTQQAPPPFAISPNWSGYVIPSSSSLILSVGGQWTVPTLNCSDTKNAGETTWVGIGGVDWQSGGTSGALLQTGVTDNCVNGIQQDSGWWEEFPSTPNAGNTFNNFTVAPGDTISASVFQDAQGSWETILENLTTNMEGVMITGEGWGVQKIGESGFTYQGTTTNLHYGGGYTAEWIVEDYATSASSSTYVPFANYGSVTFTQLTTSLSPWYLTSSEGYEMVQNNSTLSLPSTPSSDGFSVYYNGS